MVASQLNPSNESLEVKDIKVVGEDVPTPANNTLMGKVGRIDRGVLAYVAKQMGRSEITGEVIGKTLLFQEDMEVNQ